MKQEDRIELSRVAIDDCRLDFEEVKETFDKEYAKAKSTLRKNALENWRTKNENKAYEKFYNAVVNAMEGP